MSRPRTTKLVCAVTTGSLLDRFDTHEAAVEWLKGEDKDTPMEGFVDRMIKALLDKYNGDVNKVRDHIIDNLDKGIIVRADNRVHAIIPTLFVDERDKQGRLLDMRVVYSARFHANQPFEAFELSYGIEFKVKGDIDEVLELEDGAMEDYRDFGYKRARVTEEE